MMDGKRVAAAEESAATIKASAASDAKNEAATDVDLLAQIRELDECQAREALAFLHGWMRVSGDLGGMRQALESVGIPHKSPKVIYAPPKQPVERIADALEELIAAVREPK